MADQIRTSVPPPDIFQFKEEPTINLNDAEHYWGQAENLEVFEDLLYKNVVPDDEYEEGFVVIESPSQWGVVRWFEIGEQSQDPLVCDWQSGIVSDYSLLTYMDIQKGDHVYIYHNHPIPDSTPVRSRTFLSWPSPVDFSAAVMSMSRHGILRSISEDIEVQNRVISEPGVFSYQVHPDSLRDLSDDQMFFLLQNFNSQFFTIKYVVLPERFDVETGNIRTDADRTQGYIANISGQSLAFTDTGEFLLGDEFMKMEFIPRQKETSQIFEGSPLGVRVAQIEVGIHIFIIIGMVDVRDRPVRLKMGDKIMVRRNGKVIYTKKLSQDQDVGIVAIRDLLPKDTTNSDVEDSEWDMSYGVETNPNITFTVHRDNAELPPISLKDCHHCLPVDQY